RAASKTSALSPCVGDERVAARRICDTLARRSLPDAAVRILIAPDSFKDALPAAAACHAIAAGLRSSYPAAILREFPMADGGEGALAVLSWHLGLRAVEIATVDPLQRPLRAAYGIAADGKTAVIEMATASGLELLTADERDAGATTTYGTGLM